MKSCMGIKQTQTQTQKQVSRAHVLMITNTFLQQMSKYVNT